MPIILLIERTNSIRWKQYLVAYSENVVALKFTPDGSFIVFTVENDPLKLFFLKTSDGSSLGAFMQVLGPGYQRDSRACYGNCIQFSHYANSIYLALQGTYDSTDPANDVSTCTFDPKTPSSSCDYIRAEVIKMDYVLPAGTTPMSLNIVWDKVSDSQSKANVVAVVDDGTQDEVYIGGYLSRSG